MRLSVVRDGKRETIEVDLAGSTVEVGGRRYPFKVVAEATERLELEIGGEKVVVEGWPKGLSQPPGPVDVNGERWRVGDIQVEGHDPAPARPPNVTGEAKAAAPAAPPKPIPPSEGGSGHDVVPPMPGKIIEVRVHEGDHVQKNQILLVLEAMKMRNEITSPVAGRVVAVSVVPGANVRARETMVRIQPD